MMITMAGAGLRGVREQLGVAGAVLTILVSGRWESGLGSLINEYSPLL